MKKTHSITRTQAKPNISSSFFKGKMKGRFFHDSDRIQTKRRINYSQDKYEVEADRVADQVVNNSNFGTPVTNTISPLVRTAKSHQSKGEDNAPADILKQEDPETQAMEASETQEKESETIPSEMQKQEDPETQAMEASETQEKESEARPTEIQKQEEEKTQAMEASETQKKESETIPSEMQKQEEEKTQAMEASETQEKESETIPSEMQKQEDPETQTMEASETQEKESETIPSEMQKQEDPETQAMEASETKEKESEARPSKMQKQEDPETQAIEASETQEKESETIPSEMQKQEDPETQTMEASETQEKESEARPSEMQKQEDPETQAMEASETQEKESETLQSEIQKQEEEKTQAMEASETQEKESETLPTETQKQEEKKIHAVEKLEAQEKESEAMPSAAQMWKEEETQAMKESVAQGKEPNNVGKEDRGKQLQQKENSQKVGQTKPEIQSSSESSEAPINVSEPLQHSKGKGSTLSPSIKNEMEAGFGADFSEVRIHTGANADSMSKSLHAKAFAHEKDIYFRQGNYDPNSQQGKRLLAHELTHTVQQGASIQRKPASKAESVDLDQIDPQASKKESEGQKRNSSDKPTPKAPKKTENIAKDNNLSPTPDPDLSTEEVPAVGLNQEVIGAPQGTGEMEEVAEIESIDMEGSSVQTASAVLDSSPSQVAAAYPGLGTTLESKVSAEKQQTQAEAPVVKAENSGKVEEGITPASQLATPTDPKIDEQFQGGVAEAKLPPHENKGETPNNKDRERMLDNKDESSFVSWLSSKFFQFTSGIKTKDPGLNTGAGERPTVDTSGEADPKRTEDQREQTTTQMKGERDKTSAAFKNNPGQQNIQPVKIHEHHEIQLAQENAEAAKTEASEGMSDYAQAALPENVRTKADSMLAPGIQQNVSQPKGQIDQAAKTREADKEKEISHTKSENERLNRETEKEQKDIVISNRKKVADKQQEGIKQAHEEVKAFDGEASVEQAKTKGSVKDKIKEKEKEADQELVKGEKNAEDERLKGERQAKEKKKELEKKKEKKSFWGRIASAIKDAVKVITSAIDKIFTAVRNAVKKAIEAAKNLALKAVEAARKWVVDKLNKFRDWLKSKVNKYLKNFPALAKRINGLIDKAVDGAIAGVNAVAEKLKKGIEKLAKALTAALDKILNAFQTALKAAVQIAGALLTGDFAEALKIAIKAACDIAGVDSNKVFAFLEKAKAKIMKILKDPVGFFKFLAKGVGQGIQNFIKPANLKKHLIAGLIGWLTGAMGGLIKEIPKKLDLMGIFSLVAQVLGLTYESIKGMVIKAYPPAQKIFALIEKAFEWIPKLISPGPIALVKELKGQIIGNLKSIVLGAIRSYLTKQVIIEGIKWVLSLVNPAGAIVKVVKAIYDFAMFLIERYQQIKSFVMTVYNTLAAIIDGNLSPVIKGVENALAKAIPVTISLLASLAGLGGIAKEVKNIIGKVSKPIRKAVQKLVNIVVKKAKKLFKSGVKAVKKGGEAIKKALNWGSIKKVFKSKDGEQHKLFFRGKGKFARLMIASDEGPFEGFINKVQVTDPEGLQAKANAIAIARQIDNTKKKPEPTKEEVEVLLTKLSKHTNKLFGKKEDHPISEVNWQTDSALGGIVGQRMVAKILTSKPPKGISGSKPTRAKHPAFDKLNLRLSERGGSSYYVKGHLLNDNLHGPGEYKNLTPLSKQGNSNHAKEVESKVKAAVQSGAIVKYTVQVSGGFYKTPVPTDDRLKKLSIPKNHWMSIKEIRKAEKFVPKKLKNEAFRIELDGSKVKNEKKIVSKIIENPVDINMDNYNYYI